MLFSPCRNMCRHTIKEVIWIQVVAVAVIPSTVVSVRNNSMGSNHTRPTWLRKRTRKSSHSWMKVESVYMNYSLIAHSSSIINHAQSVITIIINYSYHCGHSVILYKVIQTIKVWQFHALQTFLLATCTSSSTWVISFDLLYSIATYSAAWSAALIREPWLCFVSCRKCQCACTTSS